MHKVLWECQILKKVQNISARDKYFFWTLIVLNQILFSVKAVQHYTAYVVQ